MHDNAVAVDVVDGVVRDDAAVGGNTTVNAAGGNNLGILQWMVKLWVVRPLVMILRIMTLWVMKATVLMV